jgi:hypothetical protein
LVHNSVGRPCLLWLGKHGERQFDHAARPIECEPADGPAHAGDDVVPAGGCQAPGGAAADAAEADHGMGETALSWFRHGHAA